MQYEGINGWSSVMITTYPVVRKPDHCCKLSLVTSFSAIYFIGVLVLQSNLLYGALSKASATINTFFQFDYPLTSRAKGTNLLPLLLSWSGQGGYIGIMMFVDNNTLIVPCLEFVIPNKLREILVHIHSLSKNTMSNQRDLGWKRTTSCVSAVG